MENSEKPKRVRYRGHKPRKQTKVQESTDLHEKPLEVGYSLPKESATIEKFEELTSSEINDINKVQHAAMESYFETTAEAKLEKSQVFKLPLAEFPPKKKTSFIDWLKNLIK